MNKEELFEKIHQAFTGEEKGQVSKLIELAALPSDEALSEAQKYLAWAQRGQEKAQSDMTYWMYEGDITLGKLLVAIFGAVVRGVEDFPEIPNVEGKVLMDKAGILQEWADTL